MVSSNCVLYFALFVTVFFGTIHAQQLLPVNEGSDGNELTQVVQPDGPIAIQRERLDCDPEFRTIDGVCTNRFLKLWGSTGRAQGSLSRFSSSATATGRDLPSARRISNDLCKQVGNVFNSRNLNELLVFFGQFIDHTIVLTPGGDEEMPIPIPSDDPIFANFSGELKFIRSLRVKADIRDLVGLGTGIGQSSSLTRDIQRPVNSLTSLLDLASVYGAEQERADYLRTFSGGKLKTSAGNLLPLNDGGLTNAPLPNREYFLAGDVRSNEHPVLTSFHTLFLREHNNICDELASKFPTWGDDRLYNMARKINGAQFQKIVLEEFYPAIVGKSLPRYTGLKRFTNPVMLDVFTTAAFRVGHTLVGNQVHRRGAGNSEMSALSMEEMFFRRASRLTEGIEVFLRGAMQNKAQEVDIQVHDALRNFLFTGIPEEEEIGFDLVALNIQRGRDHALPSFNEIRRSLRIPRATSFAGITSNANLQSALQSVYGVVDKVEAWVGLVCEDHAAGSSLGRTMIAVWEKQFRALRDGDRFYYRNNVFSQEVRDKVGRVGALFTESSILKSLITRNSDISDSELPPKVFFK